MNTKNNQRYKDSEKRIQDALMKLMENQELEDVTVMDITKKWTGRRQDWSVIHAQLAVFFADRMPD